MELIIVIAIILVCCLILNVNFNYILFGVIILMCVLFALMAIGFTYCVVRLTMSKAKEASFVRFDKGKNNKFQVACYEIDGEEYRCMFPKEFIMQKKLYPADRTYKVMLDMKSKKVYDRYAITTCILGLIISVSFSVGMVVFWCHLNMCT